MLEIISQIIGILALCVTIICYQFNDQKKILIMQIIASVLFMTNLALRDAMAGALLNIHGICRALVFYQRGRYKWAESPLLLAYTVEAAIESGKYDIVHVSTDSELYADIAKEYGADVPFLRDENLAGDKASSWDAVRYVVSEYEKRGKYFDTISLLQPTSPLRTAEDICWFWNTTA